MTHENVVDDSHRGLFYTGWLLAEAPVEMVGMVAWTFWTKLVRSTWTELVDTRMALETSREHGLALLALDIFILSMLVI